MYMMASFLAHMIKLKRSVIMDKEDSVDESSNMEPDSDWRDKLTMAGCLSYLSENKLWHDVTFLFQRNGETGKLLHAHRLILSLRSPVFQAMFFGSLTENQENVEIVDIDPGIFDHVLRYIYTDQHQLNEDNVLLILYAAKKYCLSGLVNACASYLEQNLSYENVCTVYEHAKMFNMDTLVQTCFQFMTEHSSAVSLAQGSTCLSFDSLMEFLSSESLDGKEIDYFKLANQWADQQCKSKDMDPSPENKRNVLGEIITKINYTKIEAKDVSEVVAPTNILLPDEQISLFQYMITHKKAHIEKYPFLSSRNMHTIDIGTGNLEGHEETYDSFKFTFCGNVDMRLVKLFPLKVPDLADFGKENVKSIDVCRENWPFHNFSVPVDRLDDTGSLISDLGVLFKANSKYTVTISISKQKKNHHRHSYYERVGIPTLSLSHTDISGYYSCTIETIPVCVKKVQFRVVEKED